MVGPMSVGGERSKPDRPADGAASGAISVAAVLDAMADTVLVVDTGGTICFANRAAVDLLGFTVSELLGMSVEELVPTHERGRHQRQRNGYSAGPTVRAMGSDLDIEARCKDGTIIAVDIRLAPLPEGGHVVVTIADMRTRRREEAGWAEERARSVRLAERDRTSRLAHDLVLQRLFGVTASLSVLAGRLPPPERARVLDCARVLDATVVAVRSMIFEDSARRPSEVH